MAKVLVTGASGFIGFNLVQELVERGDCVTALVRSTSRIDRLKDLPVTLASGDVTEPASLRDAVGGQEIVYHIAGLTRSLSAGWLWRVNEEGVRNVAQACADSSRPPVLVVVSSLAAAGPAPKDRPRCEDDPPQPVSFYGRSKLAGEQAARAFADAVPITIVRPPVVFGPADVNGLPMFRTVKRWGIHLVPGWGRRRYSLIHSEDLVELFILAAEKGERLQPNSTSAAVKPDQTSGAAQEVATVPTEGIGRGIYFAAGPEYPTWAELGQLVARAVGRRKACILRVAKPGVWMIAGCVELLERLRRRPMYLDFDKAREVNAGSWACSSRKAFQQLGFAPKAPLFERLRQTADWYRAQGWL